MAIKDKTSYLPTSVDPVKENGGCVPIRSVFRWLHIVATTLTFFWLAVLTLCSIRPEANVVLPKYLFSQLTSSQEVRKREHKNRGKVWSLHPTPPRQKYCHVIWLFSSHVRPYCSFFLCTPSLYRSSSLSLQKTQNHFSLQNRDARQLVVVSGAPTIEGDIVDQSSHPADPTLANAHIANPNRLWPNGLVEYEFHPSFPRGHREIMGEVMQYFEEKVHHCIKFKEKTETTIDYVLIYPGVSCNSKVGRTGNEQLLNLNRCNWYQN